jgi:aspartate aminotransferase
MRFAKRVLDVPPSATFKYSALAKKEGVINLTVGRPGFDTPKVVKEAAKKALDEGKVHYTPEKGIPELRQKIAEKLERENGIKGIDSEKVIVSMGGKMVLYEIMMALVDKGDKVAIPNPGWVSYDSMVKLAEGESVWLPLKADNGFIPDDEFLGALDRSKAKIVVVNSPSNPTGAVYPESVLRKIIKIAEDNDMWIIADEVYEKLIFEGKHFSIGSVYPKTITVNAFSKTFSMTGWRLGYAACQEFEVINKMGIIQSQSASNPVSFAQYGALACFTPEAEAATKAMVEELEKRRDYSMKRIVEFNAVCKKPNGAFYIFPRFDGQDDVELADAFLEAGVGTVPGSPFGSNGRGCIRISYGSGSIKELGTAFDRMLTVKGVAK